MTLSALTLAVLAWQSTLTSSGYIAKIANSNDSVATAPYFTCSGAYGADKASATFQFFLNETAGATIASDSGGSAVPDTGAYNGSMTTSTATPIACSRDGGSAYVLNGSSSYVSTLLPFNNPATFSEEVWFKTSVAGGKLMGFGSSQVGSSVSYDRHLYIETTGLLDFGTFPGTYQVITSPSPVNDGMWHQAVATMSAATGMKLYLDGKLVASNASYTAAQNFVGYWRVGYDNTFSWPNTSANYFFAGQMRYAAVYTTVLSQSQITAHYLAGQ